MFYIGISFTFVFSQILNVFYLVFIETRFSLYFNIFIPNYTDMFLGSNPEILNLNEYTSV